MKRLMLASMTVLLAAACGGPVDEEATTEEALTTPIECPAACDIVPGDANSDGRADIFDVRMILAYLFSGDRQPCLAAADANQDGAVDISDAILIGEFYDGEDVTLLGPPCDICNPDCSQIVAGDVNQDGQTDITDFSNLVGWLYSGNPEHVCELAADVNGDGNVDQSDVITLSQWMWQGVGSLSDPICQ